MCSTWMGLPTAIISGALQVQGGTVKYSAVHFSSCVERSIMRRQSHHSGQDAVHSCCDTVHVDALHAASVACSTTKA
jgi:hypothetical protein